MPLKPSNPWMLKAIAVSVDLSLGLFNLTDKAYVRWSDGIAIGSSDAPLRFSQPGFHAGLNLRITL
jgi:outer membrane receptor protein involved in Fe transport